MTKAINFSFSFVKKTKECFLAFRKNQTSLRIGGRVKLKDHLILKFATNKKNEIKVF